MASDHTCADKPTAGMRNGDASLELTGGFCVTVFASDRDVTAFFDGRLTAASVAASARRILDPIEGANVREVILDGSHMTYCDGAGIGLIGEVRRTAALNGSSVRYRGFSR